MIQVVNHKIGLKKPKGYKVPQQRQVSLIQSRPPVAAVYTRKQEMPSDLSGTVKTRQSKTQNQQTFIKETETGWSLRRKITPKARSEMKC